MAGRAVYTKMAAKYGASAAKAYLYGQGSHPLEEKYGKLQPGLKFGDEIAISSAKDFKKKIAIGDKIAFKGNGKEDKTFGVVDSFKTNGVVIDTGIKLRRNQLGEWETMRRTITFKNIGDTPFAVQRGNRVNMLNLSEYNK